jgi:integrase
VGAKSKMAAGEAGGHGGRRPRIANQNVLYQSWKTAAKDAGFPDPLFHDLRRSAVRNMVEKIGMSEKRAMEMSGHKTQSCFERYHIVSTTSRRVVKRWTYG